MQNLPVPGITGPPTFCPICNDMVACIVAGLDGSRQANYASSQVFLGLTPTLLAAIAPSVGEFGLLAANRPLLGFLLGLGVPSVFFTRTLAYDDPVAALNNSRGQTLFLTRKMDINTVWPWILSVMEYLIAIAALGNLIHNSWTLGRWTIVSWSCDMWYLPLIWSFGAVAVHLLASGAFLASETMSAVRKDSQSSSSSKNWGQAVWRCLCQEFTVCGARSTREFRRNNVHDETRPVVALNLLAQVCSYVLIFYGTVTLSSLMFIPAGDAMVVVLRYFLSTMAVRVILMIELSGLVAQ
jgi:hypothetical protein